MSHTQRNHIWVVLLVLVLLLVPLGVINAQAPQALPTPYPGEDGASYDARVYAAHYNVSAKEAKRRFALQDAAGDLDAQLSSQEQATFAGLWLEHTPKFKVVVQFTGAGKSNVVSSIQNKELAAIVEMRTAKISLADLKKAQLIAISSFAATRIHFESGINVQKNRVEMYVLAQDRPNITAQMRVAQLPSFVEIITVPSMTQPTENIYGGVFLYGKDINGQGRSCTSGFPVKNSVGLKGVSTAGHCLDVLLYNTKHLNFVKGLYKGSYDVQWHTAPGYTITNKIQYFSNGAVRAITGTKSRNDQAIGEYVCKYGIASFYTCGTISDKNYVPDYQEPGVTFNATFIRVDATAGYFPLTKFGDSGGPWFLANVAYGIHSGGGSYYGMYTAVNYLSGIGVSVMTTP